MRAAQVTSWGQSPKLVTVPDLPAPGPDEVRIKVKAVGIHALVRSRASGNHYTSGNTPHTPGVDGVGTTEDGQVVYWMSFQAGSLTEYVNVPKNAVRPLPAGSDPVQIAALVNPAMSSWMAIKTRTTDLPKDFTVLVLGATSASGRIAITFARSLGAKRVIGVARDQAALNTLGLDQAIVMASDVSKTDFSSLGDVDVVLDYIYGPLATQLLSALASTRPVQYVQIGALSGQDMALPSAVLRGKNLTIRGTGPGAWSPKQMAETLSDLLEAVGSILEQPVTVAKVKDVESAWETKSKGRLVIVVDE